MPHLSKITKLKLIVPILYAFATIVYFVVAWPDQPLVHHLMGVIISLISFVLWIVARIQLGNAFSVAPMSKYLVTDGLYGKLRHPVYYFSISAAVGIALFIWQLVIIAPIMLLVCLELFRIKKEESILSSSFDKEYLKYKKRTWF